MVPSLSFNRLFITSFICRCSQPQVGITYWNPTYPCWSWLQVHVSTFSLTSLHCCCCFGMALIQNTSVSSWTAPASVLDAEVACDVNQDVIPGDCALLSAGWPGEELSLAYAHPSPVWQVATQLQFWSSLQAVSFFLVIVEIWHHCKGEPQKNVTRLILVKRWLQCPYRKSLTLLCLAQDFMAGVTSAGLPWVLMQVAMWNSFGGWSWVKSGVLASPFPTSNRGNNSCFATQSLFRWSFWKQVKPVGF